MAKLLEHETTVVERARLGVPPGVREAEFVAFVVWLPDTDEFLHRYAVTEDISSWMWAKSSPGLASRFTRLKRAQKVAGEKPGAVVAVLFDTPRQFLVLPVDLDEPHYPG